ncbi:MAG: hypothetical protein RLZZ292_1633 [Bacteroidota bacterium]|jgi:hypothetical protein
MVDFEVAEAQIRAKKKEVDFDTKDFTIEFIVKKYESGEIYIPDYQRDFVWDDKRKSKFIESILLGLPIPSMFLADVSGIDEKEGDLEIVDGSQRIRTLDAFVKNKFRLNDLEILSEVNTKYYKDFPTSRQKRFLNHSLKTLVLSETTDPDARFMMFERINTGADELKAMEQRKGIYRGLFTDFIYNECSQNEVFKSLTFFTPKVKIRNEAEELILRFFAYSEKYEDYKKDDAYNFFNDYLKEKNKDAFDKAAFELKFNEMLQFVQANFPNGFLRVKNSTQTPRVRFEAISVGVSLALAIEPDLKNQCVDTSWTESEAFIEQITGSATSSPNKVHDRINFVRDKILGKI